MAIDRSRITGLLGRVRRQVLLRRRALAALCAGAAVLLGVQATRPAPAPTVPVWTAAHDLAAGAVLGGGDLRQLAYPADVLPAHAVRAPPLGRVVAAPARRGQPLTDLSLVGRPLLAHYPGRTGVAVRLADPDAAGLLRTGDRVDVVVADTAGGAEGSAASTGRLLSSGARVVAVPSAASGPSGVAGSAGGAGLGGRLVLLAVPAADAADVAAAALGGFLTLTLTG